MRDGKHQKSQDGDGLVGRRCFPSQSMIGKGTEAHSVTDGVEWTKNFGKEQHEKHHVTPRLNE